MEDSEQQFSRGNGADDESTGSDSEGRYGEAEVVGSSRDYPDVLRFAVRSRYTTKDETCPEGLRNLLTPIDWFFLSAIVLVLCFRRVRPSKRAG